jgi:hypothetical protein
MTLAMAESMIGALSNPSKMPGWGWGISALNCNIGSKLREVVDSVCNECYAMRNRYLMENVMQAHAKRQLTSNRPEWADLMAFMINLKSKNKGGDAFRWFDSGDLQSVELLTKICQVCVKTPKVKHYLPTKEYKIVQDYVQGGGVIPDNLCIRFSAYIIDGPLPQALAQRLGVQTASTVTSNATCPAKQQNNKCLDCRICWDKSTPNVSYIKH